MDAEINNFIYMELNSGPKIANSTCGKTIIAETIERDSTVHRAGTSQMIVQTKYHNCWSNLFVCPYLQTLPFICMSLVVTFECFVSGGKILYSICNES